MCVITYTNCYSVMFIVAIIPLMFSPGIEFRSVTLVEGVSTYPLTVDGSGVPFRPLSGESWSVRALPLADA